MARWLFLFVLAVIAVSVLEVHGSVFHKSVNTDNGFCEDPEYGRIPIGGTGYNDEKCRRYSCSEGAISGASCGAQDAPAGCSLVRGTGHYPDCCPRVRCGSEDSSDN
ncbi:toxin-like protein 14 [Stegodyphus dumicola]|uniref:toxin-like protein 14 n=1 Tax=Stegodyphus dumicola TaxID=202533 RepID=UPI0015AAC0F8|nr:toxin-like protein 14 [Stegodyphus dumicola]